MTASPRPNAPAEAQRDALLESQRRAHEDQPGEFKQDALDDKVVSVEPDGTGPSSTGSFDTERDRALGSGNESPTPASRP